MTEPDPDEADVPCEIVDGAEWINGTTEWRVVYEYASADGGGYRTDYFKTANRNTPPTGPQIRACLDSEDMTVIGIESIEWLSTDTPDSQPSLEAPPEDSYHHRVFDPLRNDLSDLSNDDLDGPG